MRAGLTSDGAAGPIYLLALLRCVGFSYTCSALDVWFARGEAAVRGCGEGLRLPVLHVHAETRVWGVQHQRQEDLWSVLTLALWILAPLLACSGPRATVASIFTPRCSASTDVRCGGSGGRCHANRKQTPVHGPWPRPRDPCSSRCCACSAPCPSSRHALRFCCGFVQAADELSASSARKAHERTHRCVAEPTTQHALFPTPRVRMLHARANFCGCAC